MHKNHRASQESGKYDYQDYCAKEALNVNILIFVSTINPFGKHNSQGHAGVLSSPTEKGFF